MAVVIDQLPGEVLSRRFGSQLEDLMGLLAVAERRIGELSRALHDGGECVTSGNLDMIEDVLSFAEGQLRDLRQAWDEI